MRMTVGERVFLCSIVAITMFAIVAIYVEGPRPSANCVIVPKDSR